MKIEIWSDIICPFCYIGKRKFEAALDDFAEKDQVQVEWKSFQLMPELLTEPDKTLDEVLAEKKGLSLEQARQMNGHASQLAKEAGLIYNMDQVIPANTLKAHELLHFAKKQGKQNQAEELLFQSYFTDGKNIDDLETLLALGTEIGLNTEELRVALLDKRYAAEVQADIVEARQIGVRGVPFFVFNRIYAVSGAQPSPVFLETLEKSFQQWQYENKDKGIDLLEGKTCSPGKDCE